MECREPLFLTGVVLQKNSVAGHGGTVAAPVPNMYSRGGYSHQPQNLEPHRLPAAEKIMLPIPKNLVLISMMEAAMRQAKEASVHSFDPETQDPESDALAEEEEYNLDRIITGMTTFSGASGTYAVKDDTDLFVVPTDPRRRDNENEEEKKLDEMNRDLPLALHVGQTIQVVSFENGIATLARGAGYIEANGTQLAKGKLQRSEKMYGAKASYSYLIHHSLVGGPRETSCRLEGLLETIENRGKDLEATLTENRQIEADLKRQIQECLEAEPDHPVISNPAETDIGQENNSPKCYAEDEHFRTPFGTPLREHHMLGSIETSTGSMLEERLVEGAIPVYPRSPNSLSVDNSEITGVGLGIPSYRRADDEANLNDFPSGCGAAFLESGSALFGNSNYLTSDRTATLLASTADSNFHGNSNSPRRATLTGGPYTTCKAYDPFAHGLPTLTSSFDAIDFRTGLSGHRGLTNVKKTNNTTNWTPRANIRSLKMSEHRGIGRVNVRQHSPTSSPSSAQANIPDSYMQLK